MKKWFKKPSKEATHDSAALLKQFIQTRNKVNSLPPLSSPARAEFNHGVDIDHLYYSSKIEGSILTTEQLEEIPRS